MSLFTLLLSPLAFFLAPERNVEFTYRFHIEDVSPDANKIQAWIPLPPNDRLQTVESYKIEGEIPAVVLKEAEFGNQMIRLDLTKQARGEGGKISVSVSYRVRRKAFEAPAGDESTKKETLARFLSPDKLVPIDGKIAAEAKQTAGTAEGSLTRARSLFDHIVSTVKYDKSGQGWGRGDAVYACDVRKGNCTDFHSLFIGQARSLGIPARFFMGFSLPENATEGKIGGYHCWAEFYVEGKGWLPVDASEASKFPDKKDSYFTVLDPHRIQFSMGRDIRLPEASSEPVNFFIYPYVEVDGKNHPKVKNDFSFKEVAN